MVYIWLDIAYTISILLYHIVCLGNAYMQAVKYIFWYLKETSHYKLKFQADDSIDFSNIVYVDLD